MKTSDTIHTAAVTPKSVGRRDIIELNKKVIGKI